MKESILDVLLYLFEHYFSEEGSLARDIVADLQAGGSAISTDDLAGYEAKIVEPLPDAVGFTP